MYPSSASVLFTLVTSHLTTSYPFGAPACVSSPRHGHSAQTSELELEIHRDISQDGDIRIKLGHPDSNLTFRGFLVKTKAPGEFLVEEGGEVAGLECSGILGSAGPDSRAVTHTTAQDRNSVVIHFRMEEGAELQPQFDLIILKNYTTFWTDISV